MNELTTSLRMWLGTLVICCVLYTAFVLFVGQIVAPARADGSLVVVDGRTVGSAQIAQDFDRPEYAWPRPSAVDYDAAATGGSNLSPTNALLTERAAGILAALEAPAGTVVPADLVAASGSGMDPHVTLEAALLQAPRIARTRGAAVADVEALVDELAFYPSGIPSGRRLVTVLLLNVALDEHFPVRPAAAPVPPNEPATR